MKQGTPDIPAQEIAPMTGYEEQGLGWLSNILSGGAFEDPSQSTYWKGLRDAMKTEEAEGVAGLRRDSQSYGQLNSSDSGRAEADYRSKMSANRMQVLGGLYNTERERDNPYTRLSAGMQYGSLPRQLEQAGNDAGYNALMQKLNFPYQTLAPLSNYFLGVGPQTTVMPGQASGLQDAAAQFQAFSSLFPKPT